jgi:hypothetical protein
VIEYYFQMSYPTIWDALETVVVGLGGSRYFSFRRGSSLGTQMADQAPTIEGFTFSDSAAKVEGDSVFFISSQALRSSSQSLA